MEIKIKSIILFAAVMLTGLSAGLFYAWAVSIIPGHQRISDQSYMEAMHAINRAILNPLFFLIFMGSMILMFVSTLQLHGEGVVYWMMLGALIVYALGTFGVTMVGNVPLNNELDALDVNSMGAQALSIFRQHFELKWNKLHMIRTVFSVLSFALSLGAVFFYSAKK